MDKKKLTELEHEAIKDAETFAITFAVSFAVLAKPALHAATIGDAKSVIVAAAIAGSSLAFKKTRPLLVKLVIDTLAGLVNRKKPAPPAAKP